MNIVRIRTTYGAKVALVTLVLFSLASLKYSIDDVKNFSRKHKMNPRDKANIKNPIDKWIIVDGSGLSTQHNEQVEDVIGWRILIYGVQGQLRCKHCLFVKDYSDIRGHFTSIPVSNLKMAVYLFVISHGAKWIYLTTHAENIQEQVQGFHLNERSTWLYYEGRVTFDPDRHFGIKDMSIDHTIRNQRSNYTLGDFLTPSIQVRWKPPNHLIGNSLFDIENVACRQPRIIVPPKYYPISDLSGSLIERRSFWALGSLMGDSPYWTLWWVLLMDHLDDVIASYPPSCKNDLNFPTSNKADNGYDNIAAAIKCKPKTPFYPCGIHIAARLKELGLFFSAEVRLIQNWFHALTSINYKAQQEGIRNHKNFLSGPLHQVLFEQTCKTHPQHSAIENPFNGICKFNNSLTLQQPIPAIRDILLIVIFNHPGYYSNIVYLDYLYRQYFTNIVYCGMSMKRFKRFQRLYLKPLTFVEVDEEFKGFYGYMCAATAMGMGYKVNGFLQISDDVLVNMWNIKTLPRDKIWFQSRIRKGALSQKQVPNIDPLGKGRYWNNWSNAHWGVVKLRRLWQNFTTILQQSATMKEEASWVESFLLQLRKSFGTSGGAFYEASDIFYVPYGFKDKFRYLSKLCYHHKIFLEIAIPTMLCGLDDVKHFVKLQGSYLWRLERNVKTRESKYNVEQHFIHPMKFRNVIGNRQDEKFVCTKYLPFVLRNK